MFTLFVGLLCLASTAMSQQFIDGQYTSIRLYQTTVTTPTVFVTVTETTGTVTVLDILTKDECIPMKTRVYNTQYVTETFVDKTTLTSIGGTSTLTFTTSTSVDVATTAESDKSTAYVTEGATQFSSVVLPVTTTLTETNYRYVYDTSSVTLWLEQTDFFSKMLVKTEVIPDTVHVTVTKVITDVFISEAPERHNFPPTGY
ncbi:unnamed protein product [Meganyctiphanes norvegica]|uniref:Uncharacterized protein n=1 Tax=Meganyctiphanes norvegica TaxID=48144 RepID=A0AAV2QL48_MEGNR